MKTTITEALSEVNLIKKKIEAGRTAILTTLVRPKHLKDAYESEGGSTELIKRATQSLNDLYKRLEKIRGAISQANLDNEITVGETTKTIFDWLTWKREISAEHLSFVTKVHTTTKSELDKLMKQPQVYKDEIGATHLLEVVANIDLGDYLKKIEQTNETIERLDGLLSLKNATIVVEV